MRRPSGSSPTGPVLAIGVAVVAVVCCAGPALLAGGLLTGIGGAFGNPWLLGAGSMLIVAAIGYTLARRSRRRTAKGNDGGAPVAR